MPPPGLRMEHGDAATLTGRDAQRERYDRLWSQSCDDAPAHRASMAIDASH